MIPAAPVFIFLPMTESHAQFHCTTVNKNCVLPNTLIRPNAGVSIRTKIYTKY